VPPSISDRVARHKLRALGVRWEELTDRQLEYLSSWRTGT
jgi:S-adenosylhomocysteine hydrolase